MNGTLAQDAARQIGCSLAHVLWLVKAGRIRVTQRAGRLVFLDPSDVEHEAKLAAQRRVLLSWVDRM